MTIAVDMGRKATKTNKIIDGNVQLRVLSHIPDNFQGVTEIVSDNLPKPSRVNIVTKENLLVSCVRCGT